MIVKFEKYIIIVLCKHIKPALTTSKPSQAMDTIEKLEVLNLVSRLTDEISNYTGVSDKTLAEFMLDLHSQSKDVGELKEKLSEVGAEFPDAFIENVDRVIKQLHPKYKAARKTLDNKNGSSLKEKEKIFKGLALPDTAPIPSNAVDEALDQLKTIERRSHRDASPRRRRSRKSESPSPPRDRHRRYRSPEDNYGRSRRRREYSDEEDDFGRRRRAAPKRDLDDDAIVGKIYDGYVTNVKNFGAFVTLEGVRRKVDGKL